MKRLLLCAILSLFVVTACSTKETVMTGNNLEADLASCSKLSKKKQYEEAIECLEIFKSRYRGSLQGQEAELHIGDNFYQSKDYLLAAESYEAFLRDHPLHPKVDYAFYRLGLSYLMASPKAIDRDQEYLDDAIKALKTQLSLFPESSYRDAAQAQLTEARQRVGRRHFYVGRFYYRTGEYRAAIPRLLEAVVSFPEVLVRDEALYMLVRGHLALGKVDAAQELFTQMSTEFPESKWTKKAKKQLSKAKKSK